MPTQDLQTTQLTNSVTHFEQRKSQQQMGNGETPSVRVWITKFVIPTVHTGVLLL